MRETLLEFHERVGRFNEDNHGIPTQGSQASMEQAGYPRPQSIVSARTMGDMLIEYGGEHLTAFVKTITEPVEVIACWTCVRSMLESCALSAWLLEPAIDAHTRVGRVFALRYEGMEQQLTFARTTGRSAAEIASLEARIAEVDRDALALGFAPVLNRKNVRIGIGQRLPGATEIITSMLDEEAIYRMLSAVAHGHQWAISQLSYQAVGDTLDIAGGFAKTLEKTANLDGLALLGVTALKAFARPLCRQCRYYGWPLLRLEEILEDTADAINMATPTRFWRDR